jgi:hypothetical protein
LPVFAALFIAYYGRVQIIPVIDIRGKILARRHLDGLVGAVPGAPDKDLLVFPIAATLEETGIYWSEIIFG